MFDCRFIPLYRSGGLGGVSQVGWQLEALSPLSHGLDFLSPKFQPWLYALLVSWKLLSEKLNCNKSHNEM